MNRLFSFLATCGVLLAGAPAAAQQAAPPAASQPQLAPDPPADTATVRRTMRAFALCAAQANATRTVLILSAEPGSFLAQSVATQMADPGCLPPEARGTSLQFDPLLLRGELFEWRYHRDFAGSQQGTFQAVPALAYPWAGAEVDPDVRRRNLAVFRYGECIVRRAPARVRALLATQVATPAERQALDALRGDLAACLSSGVTVTLTRPILRGIVAESLYRLSIAQRNQGAPPATR